MAGNIYSEATFQLSYSLAWPLNLATMRDLRSDVKPHERTEQQKGYNGSLQLREQPKGQLAGDTIAPRCGPVVVRLCFSLAGIYFVNASCSTSSKDYLLPIITKGNNGYLN